MRQIKHRALSRSLILTRGSVLLLILLFPVFIHASELTEQQVQAAVETWVRYVTADAKPDAMIESMEPYTVDGRIMGYIAHLSGEGFCLCGVDDLVLPVYLYSPHGTYDQNIPDYQYVLWEIATRTRDLRKASTQKTATFQQHEDTLADRAVFWQELMQGVVRQRVKALEGEAPEKMQLNLNATWHQRSPYNDLCPAHVYSGERTVVGCVATAVSQIMYYWKWPNTGVGSADVDYESRWRTDWDSELLAVDPGIDISWWDILGWTDADGGTLWMSGSWDKKIFNKASDISSDPDYQNALQNLYDRLNIEVVNYAANFGATTYQWDLMADNANSLPPGGDVAVATLCHHAGVAVDMFYGLWSSSPNRTADNAFRDHFRYHGDHLPAYYLRDIELMTQEIEWLRPVYLSGCTPSMSCHAWIVIGYDKGTDPDRQFLMNMGWGWEPEWYSCDNVPGDYSEYQTHIIYIAPENVFFVGRDDSALGNGKPDEPYRDIETALTYAPDGATLIFKAGSDNTFASNSLTIDRPLTLRGHNVTIRRE